MGRSSQTTDWILEAKRIRREFLDLIDEIQERRKRREAHKPMCVCYKNGCSYCRV